MTFVSCDHVQYFRPFELMFDNYFIPIEPDSYFWDQKGDQQVCTMLIMASKYEFFILGQPFFQGYYAIHDMQYATLQLTPLRSSTKAVPVKEELPTSYIKAEKGPSIAETYGNILYWLGVVFFASYVLQPLLSKRWDINDPSNERKYIVAYIFYLSFAVSLYIFLVRPAFNLPRIHLGINKLHTWGMMLSLYGVYY